MIPVALEDVDREALQALIDNAVRESKTIEYKEKLPGKKDSDVGPLLATVSSLANTDGGDLILGVKENAGLPVELPGIEIEDADREKVRLSQMLLNGVEPRLRGVGIHEVEITKGKYVMVIRVPTSWSGPHRVKRTSKYHGRTSGAKYELDVGELRNAFLMTETIPERIRGFRAERIEAIRNGIAPVPLVNSGCMVMHVIPLSAVRAGNALDMASLNAHRNQMRPMSAEGGWSALINLDGLVTCTVGPPERSYAYAQMFRSGATEGVFVLDRDGDQQILRSEEFEHQVGGFVKQYLMVAGNLEIEPPYYAFLSFVGVRECTFQLHPRIRLPDGGRTLHQESMILPEVVMEDRAVDPFRVLKPTFDMVWNAFGRIGSRNYDEQGNHVGS